MLLGNQIFANNRKGLGFGKSQDDDKGKSAARSEIIGNHVENHSHRNTKFNQVNSMCTFCREFGRNRNNCWNRPKHVKTIPIWVPKGTNIKSLKVKQIWVPKGTCINSFESPKTYFSYSATNNNGPIKTNRSHKSFIV